MKVKINNIHENKYHPGTIYALLQDATTGEMLISSTLEYIFNALRDKERGMECVNAKMDKWGNFEVTL